MKNTNDRSRVAELVLGIMGGVFGMLGGLLAMTVGSIGSAFEANGAGGIVGLGISCVIVSALAIIFSAMINRNHKTMGWLIIVCGILNFVFVSYFGILSGILIIISGSLALKK